MIPRTPSKLQPPAWQVAMRDAITRPGQLLSVLGLDPADFPDSTAAAELFPLKVPLGYVRRMRHGDRNDPLLLQVLPLQMELQEVAGFTTDAVGDLGSLRNGGLLHKYHGRALLITTGACAVHCRYCFRRHFPYEDVNASRDSWTEALDVLRSDPSIEEVILSGGDPLSLNDRRLAALARELDYIPHLKRLRIHTRQPVVLPERVDDGLLAWLGEGRLRRIVVIHANHPREIDAEVGAALTRLQESGITLLNQSVLLRGINDYAGVLVELSEKLFEYGVMPYYLHLLDRVKATAHFEVSAEHAAVIMRQLAARLPGYLVPRLVTERAGEPSKQPVSW